MKYCRAMVLFMFFLHELEQNGLGFHLASEQPKAKEDVIEY